MLLSFFAFQRKFHVSLSGSFSHFLCTKVGILLLSGCAPKADLSPKDSDNASVTGAPENTPAEIPSEQSAQNNHPDTDVVAPSEDTVVIREKMFIAQTNDIYFNAEDYLGKTIQYEGIFDVYEMPETGETYYTVIRYGPGCCGIDANAGFEVKWNDDYPNQNDWVEAVGVLEEYEEDGYRYLRLALTSLTVLPTRGAEYVSQ